jgi:hypothetical protein
MHWLVGSSVTYDNYITNISSGRQKLSRRFLVAVHSVSSEKPQVRLLNGRLPMEIKHDNSRRRLLKWSGATAATVAVSGVWLPNFGISTALAADLGDGDIGVLNYAYALEQLEAAFYTMALENPYEGMTEEETELLTDIRDHEVAHRDFLAEALGDAAIPALEVDFSAVDFADRHSVLETAMTFEDIGVSAYNGAGDLLENPDYLIEAGRIVSVEGRHAAVIRDLVNPLSVAFAGPDVVNENGLDVVREPAEVLPLVDPFITTEVTANSLT